MRSPPSQSSDHNHQITIIRSPSSDHHHQITIIRSPSSDHHHQITIIRSPSSSPPLPCITFTTVNITIITLIITNNTPISITTITHHHHYSSPPSPRKPPDITHLVVWLRYKRYNTFTHVLLPFDLK
jgi:hypothetical protein